MSMIPGNPATADRAQSPQTTVRADGAVAGTPRARRKFENFVLHAPQALRAMVRSDEIWLVVLAAFAFNFGVSALEARRRPA